jgi:hypothetical protein
MISGTVWILQLIFMRETYPVVILARKAEKLQEETNNMALRSGLDTGISPRSLLLRSIVRPCKMLFFSPIILGLSLYIGLVYGYLYLLFSTFVLIFEEHYGFTASNVGLTYLGLVRTNYLHLFVG